MIEHPRETADADRSLFLQEAVRSAIADKRSLKLQGGESKRQLMGRHCDATPLEVACHRGVVSYRPEELVVTARAGTPISELRALLAERGQRLPFEPAEFSGQATLGGCLASGLSGPARYWHGSVRDAVLGIRLINGRGEHLRFGGEVMKNVAGYDVSRLQAGALGTLGIITELSLKVIPLPEASLHLARPLSCDAVLPVMRELASRPLPTSGMFWCANTLHLRLEGNPSAIKDVANQLCDFEATDTAQWIALREWTLDALDLENPLDCVDVSSAAPLLSGSEPVLIDWAGARRFYRVKAPRQGNAIDTPQRLQALQSQLDKHGGHVMRLGCGAQKTPVTAEPATGLRQLHRNIKQALDPANVFNPGRLYDWL